MTVKSYNLSPNMVKFITKEAKRVDRSESKTLDNILKKCEGLMKETDIDIGGD